MLRDETSCALIEVGEVVMIWAVAMACFEGERR